MRKRQADPVEVFFLTDPLCPWSWAMEPLVASLRSDKDVEFRSVLTGWLPSLEARGVAPLKKEWADAAAKTGTRIDPTYWDRVAPETSLIAGASVKAAQLQGAAKGESHMSAIRRAAFEEDLDLADLGVLVAAAKGVGLKAELFRDDLGVGRCAADDVVRSLDPSVPLSESVWWFGRRRGLRAWQNLSEDIGNAERQELASPAFHVVRGKKEAKLVGLVGAAQVEGAIRSVQ